MRGAHGFTEAMFTMANLDDFVPAGHPLRPIRIWLNDALKRMDPVFARMYESDAKGGRLSIATEKLIRALLLQVLYSIRSERMLMEQISHNMLFRWFVGLSMDDAYAHEYDAWPDMSDEMRRETEYRSVLPGSLKLLLVTAT